MTANRRIFWNFVATYGRSVYAIVIGLFCGRWTLMALGEVDYGLMGLIGGLTAFIGFFFGILSGAVGSIRSVPTCGVASWCAIILAKFSTLNEPWCESPRRYGVEESLAHIFAYGRRYDSDTD